MSKIDVPSRLYRAATVGLVRAGPDPASREVRLSFSSEAEVLRHFGFEVLGHGAGEVDLSRLQGGSAPLLLDHMPTISAKVGTVVSAEVENGRGVAVVRFAATAQADEILARIDGGEEFAVSVGYQVLLFARVGEREGNPILRAVRWMPYEISLVAVPADPSVGLGRSAEADVISVSVEGDSHMSNENNPGVTVPATPAAPAPAVAPVDAASILSAERARAEHIRSVGDKLGMPAEVVNAAVRGGESAEAFNVRALDFAASPEATATRAREAKIGLSEKEEKSYSFVRLIAHLADPTDAGKRNAAGFEIECATAAAAKHKGQVRGALVPVDVLASRNYAGGKTPGWSVRGPSDMTVGTPAHGGNLVADTFMAGSFIEMLRETAVLPRLGARLLGGLTGDITIPKKTAGAAVGWVAEDGTASNSRVQIGQVSATPHTISARTQLSRKLLVQSSLDVEQLVRADFAEGIGLEIDRCAVYGSADPGAPEGLDEKTGIGAVVFAGANPTFAEIMALWTAVRTANAARGSLGFLLHPNETAKLMTTPRFTGGDSPIMANMGNLLGFNAPDSSQVTAGDIWFGNWADLVIATWGGLDILVDPFTESTSGAVRITAFHDVDFVARHAQSFARGRRA